MKVTENTKIKEWYVKTFPHDSLAREEMKDDITFYGLFRCLDRYENVYDFLGVSDSIIRENCFAKLAELMEVDYGYVYDQWLATPSEVYEIPAYYVVKM